MHGAWPDLPKIIGMLLECHREDLIRMVSDPPYLLEVATMAERERAAHCDSDHAPPLLASGYGEEFRGYFSGDSAPAVLAESDDSAPPHSESDAAPEGLTGGGKRARSDSDSAGPKRPEKTEKRLRPHCKNCGVFIKSNQRDGLCGKCFVVDQVAQQPDLDEEEPDVIVAPVLGPAKTRKSGHHSPLNAEQRRICAVAGCTEYTKKNFKHCYGHKDYQRQRSSDSDEALRKKSRKEPVKADREPVLEKPGKKVLGQSHPDHSQTYSEDDLAKVVYVPGHAMDSAYLYKVAMSLLDSPFAKRQIIYLDPLTSIRHMTAKTGPTGDESEDDKCAMEYYADILNRTDEDVIYFIPFHLDHGEEHWISVWWDPSTPEKVFFSESMSSDHSDLKARVDRLIRVFKLSRPEVDFKSERVVSVKMRLFPETLTCGVCSLNILGALILGVDPTELKDHPLFTPAEVVVGRAPACLGLPRSRAYVRATTTDRRPVKYCCECHGAVAVGTTCPGCAFPWHHKHGDAHRHVCRICEEYQQLDELDAPRVPEKQKRAEQPQRQMRARSHSPPRYTTNLNAVPTSVIGEKRARRDEIVINTSDDSSTNDDEEPSAHALEPPDGQDFRPGAFRLPPG